ncbi:MAG TPA: glycosyltransferase family 39 protein, partial [Patescibacteria group bacterium]|nr:glycosyltransferase family 39 protein [Patescibacteria group bacterium]
MRQLLQNKFFETGMLIFIIFVAAILRLYQIGTVPPSPDWDEVALGYNAYSILLTGRDEYGEIMPFVLQSFDDYKPALYTYLIIPFLPFFDLSVFSIRLPSAIFGILTVLATYFLVKVLFQNRGLALLTAFLLAISPWHIQFSRVAFETNVGLAFNVFGALFFLKGLKKPWYLLGAALFFGLNVSVYQSDRIFTPLLLLTLICIFWRQLFSLPKKFLFLFVVIGMITVVPLVYALATNSNALARLK